MTLDEWLCQDEKNRALSFKQLTYQQQKELVFSLHARVMDCIALGKADPTLADKLSHIANRICAYACQNDAIFLNELGQDVSYTSLLVKIVLAKPSDALINKICPFICRYAHVLNWHDVHMQSLIEKALISFFKSIDESSQLKNLETFIAQNNIPDPFKFHMVEVLDNLNILPSERLTAILCAAKNDDGILINFLSHSYNGQTALYAHILKSFKDQRLIELHGHIRALDEQANHIGGRRMQLWPIYYDELASRMKEDAFTDKLVPEFETMSEKDSIHLTKGLLKRQQDVIQQKKWLERAIAHKSNQLLFIAILKAWFKKYHPSAQQLAECIQSVTRPDHFLLFYEQLYPLLKPTNLECLMDYLFKDPDRNPLIVYVLTNSPSLPANMIEKLLSGLEDQSLLTLIELLIEKDALYQENRRLVLRHFAKRINEPDHQALIKVCDELWVKDLSRLLLSDMECLEYLKPQGSSWIYFSTSVFYAPLFLNKLATNEDFQAVIQRMIFMGIHEPVRLAALLQSWLPYQHEPVIERLFKELTKQLGYQIQTSELLCDALKLPLTYQIFSQNLALKRVRDNPEFSALLFCKSDADFPLSITADDVALIIMHSTDMALQTNWLKAKKWLESKQDHDKRALIKACIVYITNQDNSVYLCRQFMSWCESLAQWPALLATMSDEHQAWCAALISADGFKRFLNNQEISLSSAWFMALPEDDYQRQWLLKLYNHEFNKLFDFIDSLDKLDDKFILALDGYFNQLELLDRKEALQVFVNMSHKKHLLTLMPVINKYMIQLYEHLNAHVFDDVKFIEQWLYVLHQCSLTHQKDGDGHIFINQSLMALMNVLVSKDNIWAQTISKSQLLAEQINNWLIKQEHLTSLNYVLLHYPVNNIREEVILDLSFQKYVSTLILSAPPAMTGDAFVMLWQSLHLDRRVQLAKTLLITQPHKSIVAHFDLIASDLPFDELYSLFKEQKAHERRLIARLLLHKGFADIDDDRAKELLDVAARHRLYQEIFDVSTDASNRQKLCAVLVSHCHDENSLSSFLGVNDYFLFAGLLVDKDAKTKLRQLLSPSSIVFNMLEQAFLTQPPDINIDANSFLYDALLSLLTHPYQGLFVNPAWIGKIIVSHMPIVIKTQRIRLNYFEGLNQLFRHFINSEHVLEESLQAARWFHRLPLISDGFLPLLELKPDALEHLPAIKSLADLWHTAPLDDEHYEALHTKLFTYLKDLKLSGHLPKAIYFYIHHFQSALEELKKNPKSTRAYALLNPEGYHSRRLPLLDIERSFLIHEAPQFFAGTSQNAVNQFLAALKAYDKCEPSKDSLTWLIQYVFIHPLLINYKIDDLSTCLRGLPEDLVLRLQAFITDEERFVQNLKDGLKNVKLKNFKSISELIQALSGLDKLILDTFDYCLNKTPWQGLKSIIKLVQASQKQKWPKRQMDDLLIKKDIGDEQEWFYFEHEINAFDQWLDNLPNQFLQIRTSMASFNKERPELVPISSGSQDELISNQDYLHSALLSYQPILNKEASAETVKLLIRALLNPKISIMLDDMMPVIWMNSWISCLLLYPEDGIHYLSEYLEHTQEDLSAKLKEALDVCTDDKQRFYLDLLNHQLNPAISLSLPDTSPLLKATFSYWYAHQKAPPEALYPFTQSFMMSLMKLWTHIDDWLKMANGEEVSAWIRFYAFVLDSEELLVDGFLRWHQLVPVDAAQKQLLRLILDNHSEDQLVLQCQQAKINTQWICNMMAGMPDRAVFIKQLLVLANWSWLEEYLMAHNNDFELLHAALNDSKYLDDIFSSDEKQQGLFERFVNGAFSFEQLSRLRASVTHQPLKCLIDTYLLTRTDFDQFFGQATLISRLGDLSNYKPSSLNLILKNIPVSFLTPERLALMQPECAVALFCSPFHSQFWSKEHLTALINKYPKPELIHYWVATQATFKHSQQMLGLLWGLGEEHIIKAFESTESKEKQSAMIATLINGWVPAKGINKRLVVLMTGQHLCSLLELNQGETKDKPVWDLILTLLGEFKAGRLHLSGSQWVFLTKFISHEALSSQKDWLSEKILEEVIHRASLGDTDLSSLHHDYDISLMRTMLTLPAKIKPNESAFLTALRDSAKREKVDASIKLIDAHLVHYQGDPHALSPLLTHYLGFYQYGRSKKNVSAELLMTTGLLLRDDVSKPFQEALYEALLGFESLLKDQVLYHMYCYKPDDILKNLGDKKSYRVLIELNSLVSERLSGDDLKERRLPLQKASDDALFEERWSMLHVRFKRIREWFARCRHYGWHGFFKPNTSHYVLSYHEHIPQTPKKLAQSLASNRQKGAIDLLDEAIKRYQGIRATADEQRALGILILKTCSLKEKAHDLMPLRMRLDELLEQWLHTTSSMDDVLYDALLQNRQEIIAYLYKTQDSALIDPYLSKVDYKKCPAILDFYHQVHPGADLPNASVTTVAEPEQNESRVWSYLNPLNYVPNLF